MGVINLGLLVDKIKRKLEDSGFIKNTDYASASAAGVVKVGTGLSVTSGGVLSATSTGFNVDVLYTGDSASETAYTFPTGKSLSDYKFLVLAIDYDGEDHDCATRIVPVSQIIAREELYTTILYNGTYFITVKVDTTKVTKYSGHASYYVNKIYAF